MCLKISGKSQGIWLMLETVMEISGEMFIFVSLVNRFPKMLEKTHLLMMKLLVFICHDGNRAHFSQIDKF